MKKAVKRPASTPGFVSPSQLTLAGFESPFSRNLSSDNRWVILAKKIRWYEICNIYTKHVDLSSTGRPLISPRVVIGSLIIKYMCNLDDRGTVAQISENMYMQYFLGYSSFSNEAPFDASLFVEFRNRMGMEPFSCLPHCPEEISLIRDRASHFSSSRLFYNPCSIFLSSLWCRSSFLSEHHSLDN